MKSNDKKRGRIAALRWVLSTLDYPTNDPDVVGTPDPLIAGPPADVYEVSERSASTSRERALARQHGEHADDERAELVHQVAATHWHAAISYICRNLPCPELLPPDQRKLRPVS